MSHQTAKSQMVFDTNCVLCSGAVHFILRHERDHEIQFVNAWSDGGIALAASYGLSRDDLDRTVLVVEKGIGLTKSGAVLALARHLRAPWSWIGIGRIIPTLVRDALYSFVATRRYRIFGYEENCFVPSPEMRTRFIDS